MEYHQCDQELLDDETRIEALMNEAARAANVTVVSSVFHRFAPQGVSGVVDVEESHLSIHTWPEHGYAAVDFYTCGAGAPDRAHEVLKRGLAAGRAELMEVERGMTPPRAIGSQSPRPGCRVRAHYTERKELDAIAHPIQAALD